jgi:hypothetical protein
MDPTIAATRLVLLICCTFIYPSFARILATSVQVQEQRLQP